MAKKEAIKVKLVCLDCKHKFTVTVGPLDEEPIPCPECGGANVDLARDYEKKPKKKEK